MTDIFKLLECYFARLHGMVGSGPFPSGDAGHLVGTDDMNPLLVQVASIVVKLTHRFDLLGEGLGVVRFGIQPIAVAVGLKFSLLLKIARHCERKSARRFPDAWPPRLTPAGSTQ